MYQFPEHQRGERSTNWRVRVLDWVARRVGVQIRIDSLPYGEHRILRGLLMPIAPTPAPDWVKEMDRARDRVLELTGIHALPKEDQDRIAAVGRAFETGRVIWPADRFKPGPAHDWRSR